MQYFGNMSPHPHVYTKSKLQKNTEKRSQDICKGATLTQCESRAKNYLQELELHFTRKVEYIFGVADVAVKAIEQKKPNELQIKKIPRRQKKTDDK